MHLRVATHPDRVDYRYRDQSLRQKSTWCGENEARGEQSVRKCSAANVAAPDGHVPNLKRRAPPLLDDWPSLPPGPPPAKRLRDRNPPSGLARCAIAWFTCRLALGDSFFNQIPADKNSSVTRPGRRPSCCTRSVEHWPKVVLNTDVHYCPVEPANLLTCLTIVGASPMLCQISSPALEAFLMPCSMV